MPNGVTTEVAKRTVAIINYLTEKGATTTGYLSEVFGLSNNRIRYTVGIASCIEPHVLKISIYANAGVLWTTNTSPNMEDPNIRLMRRMVEYINSLRLRYKSRYMRFKPGVIWREVGGKPYHMWFIKGLFAPYLEGDRLRTDVFYDFNTMFRQFLELYRVDVPCVLKTQALKSLRLLLNV